MRVTVIRVGGHWFFQGFSPNSELSNVVYLTLNITN